MVLTSNTYNTLRHRELTPLEESVYLILANNQEYDMPIVSIELAYQLSITPQYLSKIFRSLENKNYVERDSGQLYVNLAKRNLHTLPIAFLNCDEMTFKTKMSLIYLYDYMADSDSPRLNVTAIPFNRSFSYIDAIDAIEHITDNGYMLLGEKIDFNRVFNLVSRFDD